MISDSTCVLLEGEWGRDEGVREGEKGMEGGVGGRKGEKERQKRE